MTIIGPDVSSNQVSFDFNIARQQGCRTAYIKLGGDNIARYVSGRYARRVEDARSAGLRVGHYWITGGHDPVVAAQYFVRNLQSVQPSDYFVLDNEKLDNGNMYSDAEAAAWISTVQSLVGGSKRRVFMYCSESPLSSSSWAQTRATGCQALVAWYGRAALAFGDIGSWPASQIGGHQYTSGANVGGWSPVDMNAFKDSAFDFSDITGGGNVPIPNSEDEDVNGFYIQVNGAGTKYWFSPSTGKARALTSAEWNVLRAFEGTKSAGDTIDVVLPVLNVSQVWLNKAIAL